MATALGWTIHDLILFPEHDGNRYEIIDGELCVTTQPDWQHQYVSGAVAALLTAWSGEGRHGPARPRARPAALPSGGHGRPGPARPGGRARGAGMMPYRRWPRPALAQVVQRGVVGGCPLPGRRRPGGWTWGQSGLSGRAKAGAW